MGSFFVHDIADPLRPIIAQLRQFGFNIGGNSPRAGAGLIARLPLETRARAAVGRRIERPRSRRHSRQRLHTQNPRRHVVVSGNLDRSNALVDCDLIELASVLVAALAAGDRVVAGHDLALRNFVWSARNWSNCC